MLDVHRWGLITSFCSQAYMGLSMLMRNLQGNTRTSAAIARSRIFSNLGKCLSSFVLIPEVQSLIVMAQGAQCLPIHERVQATTSHILQQEVTSTLKTQRN